MRVTTATATLAAAVLLFCQIGDSSVGCWSGQSHSRPGAAYDGGNRPGLRLVAIEELVPFSYADLNRDKGTSYAGPGDNNGVIRRQDVEEETQPHPLVDPVVNGITGMFDWATEHLEQRYANAHHGNTPEDEDPLMTSAQTSSFAMFPSSMHDVDPLITSAQSSSYAMIPARMTPTQPAPEASSTSAPPSSAAPAMAMASTMSMMGLSRMMGSGMRAAGRGAGTMIRRPGMMMRRMGMMMRNMGLGTLLMLLIIFLLFLILEHFTEKFDPVMCSFMKTADALYTPFSGSGRGGVDSRGGSSRDGGVGSWGFGWGSYATEDTEEEDSDEDVDGGGGTYGMTIKEMWGMGMNMMVKGAERCANMKGNHGDNS